MTSVLARGGRPAIVIAIGGAPMRPASGRESLALGEEREEHQAAPGETRHLSGKVVSMVDVIPDMPPGTLGFRVSGRLTRDD